MASWSWRDQDLTLNPELNLLYEPGNWGDVLKSLWAVALIEALPAEHLRILDPYSGALDYPCTRATRSRLRGVALAPFRTLQADHLRRGRLASTGLLVQEQCLRDGKTWSTTVAEADPERRLSWQHHAEISPQSCEQLLVSASRRFDLILWDPYDFFEQWSHAIPRLMEAARKIPVLIYLYNKSPRGVSQMRNYEKLRQRLQGQELLCGRVPSDGLLPRAFHEILLLLPPSSADSAGLLGRLHSTLSKCTGRLYRHISQVGCFERQASEHS